MKIGVFSDVHANLEALDATLARYEKEDVHDFIFCGDLIGYGPDPEACVQKILALPLRACVPGNHDAVFAQPEMEKLFNGDARAALDSTKQMLSQKSIRALTDLPTIVRTPEFTVVHGTPADPIKEYFIRRCQFQSNYPLWEGPICFVGHTHLPFFMEGTADTCRVGVNQSEDVTIPLLPEKRYVINPGAVGKPRDHNTHASFGIWDTEAHTFRFLREPYDMSTTLRKMEEQGLPSFLISSLTLGL